MAYLISTSGPSEEWWSIKNTLSDELIDAATSGIEPVPGVFDYLIQSDLVHGCNLDRIESEEFRQGLISILIEGSQLIVARRETPDYLRAHYQKLIKLLTSLAN